jgi:hypothetical protein
LGLVEHLAIILGVLIWGVFLSGILDLGKRYCNEKFIRVVTYAAGIMLIYFALKYSVKGLKDLGLLFTIA